MAHLLTPIPPPMTLTQGKFGFKKAWLSAAAAYDIVPGAVMAFYFAQLWLLGMPLRALWGSGTSMEAYAKEHTGDKAPIEQLLVRTTGSQPPDWRRALTGVTVHEVRAVLPELYTLTVPTFKPLTAALKKLAACPDVDVLCISNQSQVQVRVQLPRSADDPEAQQLAALLKGRRGVEVMFDYAFPVDGTGGTPPKLASLCVDVPYLLGTMRFCGKHGVEVLQVYDFWS